jgi:hypothetical protein
VRRHRAPDASTPRSERGVDLIVMIVVLVVETGVDPVTPRFSGVCSAN